MARFLVLLACIASVQLYAVESKRSFQVFFGSNESVPEPATLCDMDSLLKQLNALPYFKIDIQGHTDSIGSVNYNRQLSMQRAEAIRQHILGFVTDTENIKVKWFGELRPCDVNESESGRRLNRRVVVNITCYQWNNAKEMLKAIAPEPEIFVIAAAKSAQIVTTKGMRFRIPENAFTGLTSNENIRVEVISAVDKTDWLAHGLTTMAAKGILESGGMFKLEAFQSGTLLKLNQDKKIEVEVPYTKQQSGMSLFTAKTDDAGNLVWKQDMANKVNNSTSVKLPFIKMDTNKIDRVITRLGQSKDASSILRFSAVNMPDSPQFVRVFPKEPKIPVRDSIRIYIGGARALFITARAKDRLIQKEYERRLKVYNGLHQTFDKRVVAYHKALDKFRRDSLEFQNKYANERSRIRRVRHEILKNQWMIAASLQRNMIVSELLKLKAFVISGSITQPNYAKGFIHNMVRVAQISSLQIRYNTLYRMDSILSPALFSRRGQHGCFDYNPDIALYEPQEMKDLRSTVNDAEAVLLQERIALGLANNKDLQGYYSTTISQDLDWINIDRFMKQPLNARLTIETEPESITYIIFEKTNTILACPLPYMPLPGGQDIALLSIVLKNNKPHYAVSHLTTEQGDQQIKMTYKPGIVKDIKEIMKSVVSGA